MRASACGTTISDAKISSSSRRMSIRVPIRVGAGGATAAVGAAGAGLAPLAASRDAWRRFSMRFLT
jgi:hypothetical protein